MVKKKVPISSTIKVSLDLEIPASLYEKFKNKAEIKEIISPEIGLANYLSHRLVDPDYSRYGIMLARSEVDALVELEKFAKKPFHLFGGPHFNGPGVYIKQGHVKELRIHRFLKNQDDQSSQELPPCIGNLTEIEFLDISYGLIDHIPSSLGNCKNLRILFLMNNLITEFPSEFTNLKNLEFIDIQDNKFIQIPWCLGYLESLKKVKLQNNPWNPVSQSIVNEYEDTKKIEDLISKCRLEKSDWHTETLSSEDFMEF